MTVEKCLAPAYAAVNTAQALVLAAITREQVTARRDPHDGTVVSKMPNGRDVTRPIEVLGRRGFLRASVLGAPEWLWELTPAGEDELRKAQERNGGTA